MSLLALLFAEGDAAAPQGNPLSIMVPMLLVFFVFWLVILRPMKQKEAEKQAKLLSNMKKGDRVLTTSGIYGTVISVAEKEDEVVVKVDDNTRLKMLKAAIMRNITNEEDAAAAAQAAKDAKK